MTYLEKYARQFISGSFISSITISVVYYISHHLVEYVSLLLASSMFAIIFVIGITMSLELYKKFIYKTKKTNTNNIDWNNIIFSMLGAIISTLPVVVIYLTS